MAIKPNVQPIAIASSSGLGEKSREEHSHDQVALDFSDETEVDFVNKTEKKTKSTKKTFNCSRHNMYRID